jgi:nucleotide-binding universal stress UspA family protein
MAIYVLCSLVTLGTVPWQELARSETALTDAVRRFLPPWGVTMMAITGIIATLTTVNTSMLSATREAFTMSRDGAWPRVLSRLGRFRTPYVAILAIGAIIALIAAIELVDFLAYISSSGYLFVLFWSNLAMVRLRRMYPDVKRPFRAPLFPLTAYTASAVCVLIIAFSEWQALLFGAGVLAACAVFYGVSRSLARRAASETKAAGSGVDRILVPVANPRTAESLVRIAGILAQASEDTSLCILTVVRASARLAQGFATPLLTRLSLRQRALLSHLSEEAQQRNLALYTKMRAAPTVSQGILEEVSGRGEVKLIFMGWPGPLDATTLADNPVKVVLQRASTNVAVLLDRGLRDVRQVLVPVGGGPHSRMAVRLAYEIAEQQGAEVTVLRCLCGPEDTEEMEDQLLLLREIVEEELGVASSRVATRVARASSVPEGILDETARHRYDLVTVGASEEWVSKTRLFGSVDDWVADRAPCSVLLVRAHEPAPIAWIRRQAKKMERAEPSKP